MTALAEFEPDGRQPGRVFLLCQIGTSPFLAGFAKSVNF